MIRSPRPERRAQPPRLPPIIGSGSGVLPLRNVGIPLTWLDQYRLYTRIYWGKNGYIG